MEPRPLSMPGKHSIIVLQLLPTRAISENAHQRIYDKEMEVLGPNPHPLSFYPSSSRDIEKNQQLSYDTTEIKMLIKHVAYPH